jgi:Bacteriophage HK97-gp10, putative tail-component
VADSFSVNVSLADMFGVLDGIEEEVSQAIRPAAQAGAQVIYDQVKVNVAKIGKKTGNLSSAIYQAYSKDQSNELLVTYHISWNAKKAPHGHLVENGHIQRFQVVLSKKTGKWITLKNRPLDKPVQVGARPFLRPAFDKADDAYRAVNDKLFELIGVAL